MNVYSLDRQLCQITQNHPLCDQLDALILERIGELYGTPDINHWTRDKMWYGLDRVIEVLISNGKLIGNFIYKTKLSDEYSDFGIENSMEIKSLYLFDPVTHGGCGHASFLLDRAKEIADQLGAKSIHVTVPEAVPESLEFFKKGGFNQG